MESLRIRDELPDDKAAVFEVNARAFPTPLEAGLVDALRAHGKAVVSLVAEIDGRIVGHILFSPVTCGGMSNGGVGLAPMAVLPEFQRRGIGRQLARAGLARCRERGDAYAVVLGDPAYYRQFGFATAGEQGLQNEYGVGEEFMAMALRPKGLPAAGGLIRYADEFKQLG